MFGGIVVAVAAAVLLAAGPLGTRAGLWSFVVGFGLVAAGVLLAVAAVVLSIIAGVRLRQWPLAAAGIAVGVAVIAVPVVFVLAARGAPAIHDITTDPDDPPRFDAILPLRAGAANPADYDPSVAARQRTAFPDVQPLVLSIPPDEALARTRLAADRLGWEVVASDPQSGRLEAVDTTFWFGFKDDIVVRIRAAVPADASAEAGSRIDVRSKSRVGRGDLGANAQRIRRFLDEVRAPGETG